ncbi:aspartate/glutamate racemase family protein [Xanthobacter sp. KR7-65]|uniref:aspartate/glutamate racemase family protein n=1 Tax=Xanthobacter sp. KR7-65 TaxID=3156612 RepID=UPI0032B46CDF
MKLLVLNANTTTAVTDRMVAALTARCPAEVELVAATAGFGLPYVGTRAAAAVAGHAAVEAVRAAVAGERGSGRAPFDACLHACFGEPGIEALRAENDFPVAGMAEASILTALQLGERFSIVTVGEAWPPMLRDLMRRAGLDARCAGFGVVSGDALSLSASHQDGLWAVERVVGETIAAQDPDVVIIGGAALAGYAASIAPSAPVPVLDSLVAGFEQALALARLPRPSRRVGG